MRIRPAGVSQFRALEVEGDSVRIEPTAEAPGAYPFRMRLVDLVAWEE